MNTSEIFMLMIMFSSLVGSIMYLTWAMTSCVFSKYQKARQVYSSLKCAMLGYLIPFIYCLFSFNKSSRDGECSFFPVITIKARYVVDGLLSVYKIGVVLIALWWISDYLRLRIICKNTFSSPNHYNKVLDGVKHQLNIKRHIGLYQGYNIASPYIIGIFRPRIYLPVGIYSEEKLRLVLLHELSHFKQRDLIWKPMVLTVCTLNWFNPFGWIILNQQRRWSEACCDTNCCEHGFTLKKYYQLLLELEDSMIGGLSCWAPTLIKSHRELKWRIKCMKKNSNKDYKNIHAWISVCITLCISVCIVFAMTQYVEAAYNSYIEENIDDVDDSGENELEEYVMSADEVANLNIIQERPLPYMPLGTRNINWTVRNGVTYASALFYPTNGSTVSVAVSVSPSGKTISLGLLQSDGTMKYVNGSGNFSHTFSVTQSGGHKICIVNNSGVSVTVSGFFAY